MNIDADDLTVTSLLCKSDLVFKVPLYQRPYSWGRQQWQDLWDDVLDQDDDGEHFIGSVVAIKEAAAVKGFNNLEIVDGQQRLTTISILLCALRDAFAAAGGKSPAETLQNQYLHSSTFKDKSRKLFLGRTDDKAFAQLVRGQPLEGHNTTAAYEFFVTKAKEHGDIDYLTDRFTNGIRIVLISAETPEDAFKLFETLNDRGLELSAVDLIKNYLLSCTARKHPDDLDVVIEYWDTIVNHLKGIDKIRFFRHFLLANYPGKVTRRSLYPTFKKHIDAATDLSDFVLDLCHAAEIYESMHEQTFDDPRLNEKLSDLLRLRATTSFTLLLRLFIAEWTTEKILQVIPTIEAFSLRRAVCGWSTNEMDTIYNQIANTEERLPDPESIREVLKEKSPDDEEFEKRFVARDFKQDEQTKYVLERLEYSAVGTDEKRVSSRRDVHIEHIMPQRIKTKKCMQQHGGNWVEYLDAEAGQHSEFISKIGNLTLLANELNVAASNNPFQAKKTFYEMSDIRITRDLCKYDEWKMTQIQERSSDLATQAAQIWSF